MEKGSKPNGRVGDIQNKFKDYTEACKHMSDQ